MPFPRKLLPLAIRIRSPVINSHLFARRFSSYTRLAENSQQPVPKPSANPKPTPVPRSGSELPVYPLVAIFFLGSGLFYLLVKQREGQSKQHYQMPERIRDNPPKDAP
ncbi:MAG: hypothetical protein M1821_001005 [Bathelium mastoideum]|nr:MAG: hypothetical protein M1821_001005 [Bathelium mastoideum]